MKKISFTFEEQIGEDTWRKFNGTENLKLETDLTDPKLLLPLCQDSIDESWNSKLRRHENPRRITEVVKVEDYTPPKKINWDEYNADEDDADEYEEIYD